MAKNISSQDIQNLLSGLDFPANKQAIIGQAKNKNASGEVLAALNGIPDKEYMSLEEVMTEIDSR